MSKKKLPVHTVKVRLPGHGVFWLLSAGFSGGRAIAPLSHCDEAGHVHMEAAFNPAADSYAHLGVDGKIRRYGQVIGSAKDLEVITP